MIKSCPVFGLVQKVGGDSSRKHHVFVQLLFVQLWYVAIIIVNHHALSVGKRVHAYTEQLEVPEVLMDKACIS